MLSVAVQTRVQCSGRFQVLRQQIFPEVPSSASALSVQAFTLQPPPLICWSKTLTENELFDDTFQIIKINFHYDKKYILALSSCIQEN